MGSWPTLSLIFLSVSSSEGCPTLRGVRRVRTTNLVTFRFRAPHLHLRLPWFIH